MRTDPHPPRPAHPQGNSTHTRGVTLIELMVTVAILATVLAMGAPAMTGFLERQAVESMAEQFASDVRLARTEAMKRGLPVSICMRHDKVINGQNTSTCATTAGTQGFAAGWLVFSDLNADGLLTASDGDLILRTQPAARPQIASMLRSGNALAYTLRNTGVMVGASGHIKVLPKSGQAQQRLICVNFAGRARITDVGQITCGA